MKEQNEQLQLENVDTSRIKSVSFEYLHVSIQQEPALLHPSLEDMVKSYEDRLGVAKTVKMDQIEVAVGYSRLIHLLSKEQKVRLELSMDFPDIYELGTVFVHPAFRGRGIAEDLQRELLLRFKDRIDARKLLVLGTTKTLKVLHMLDKMRRYGFNFYHSRHTDYPNLSPLTCICTPPFGEGFQITKNCSKRVSSEMVVFLSNSLSRVDKRNSDAIPCTMFVSSKSLADEIDDLLGKSKGDGPNSQRLLIRSLKNMGYYD